MWLQLHPGFSSVAYYRAYTIMYKRASYALPGESLCTCLTISKCRLMLHEKASSKAALQQQSELHAVAVAEGLLTRRGCVAS